MGCSKSKPEPKNKEKENGTAKKKSTPPSPRATPNTVVQETQKTPEIQAPLPLVKVNTVTNCDLDKVASDTQAPKPRMKVITTIKSETFRITELSAASAGSSASSLTHGGSTKVNSNQMCEDYPPLCPPCGKKTDMVPDASIFKDIDDYVKKTPNSLTVSVKSLAGYLMKICETDLQRARAIFCWIALNIYYDVESYFSKESKPQDPMNVLRTRRSVCQGYSELCSALCRAMGLPCLVVSGFAKGYSYRVGTVFTEESKTDHAWNLVYLLGEWRPMECTWGAGNVGADGKYHQQFQEFWFLTDPVEFVDRHFPFMNNDLAFSRGYQLLENPIDLDQYSRMLCLEPEAYSMGLKFISHPNNVINVKNDVTIKIVSTRKKIQSISGVLTKLNDNTQDRSNVIAYLPDENSCDIYVRPPRESEFILTIFGNARGDKGNIQPSLVKYAINCYQAHIDPEPFPENSSFWGFNYPLATECGITQMKGSPFKLFARDGQVQMIVPLSRPTVLSVKMNHAKSTEKEMEQMTFVEMPRCDTVVVNARLPRAGNYKLTLFAKHPERDSLPEVGNFLIYSDKKCPDCKPFPQSYSAAFQHYTELVQPRYRKVPPGVKTTYRVLGPYLQKVTVAGTKMELKSDGVWEAEVIPDASEKTVGIFGALEKNASSLFGLYTFEVGK